MKVTKFVRGSKVVLESDDLIRPVVTMSAQTATRGRSKLAISCYFNRRSAMFQVRGPI